MEIREYTNSDKEGILELQDEFEKEFFKEFYDNPERRKWEIDLHKIPSYYIKSGGNFWVIEIEGKVIGMVGLKLVNKNTAELTRMRVFKSFRGLGLGKQLLIIAENYCKDIGIDKIVLNTVDRLEIAKKLYETNGYRLMYQEKFTSPFEFVMLHYCKDIQEETRIST